MAIELTKEQQGVIKETRPIEDSNEFKTMREAILPEMKAILEDMELESQVPGQPVDATITTLREIYLLLDEHQSKLAPKYGQERKALFQNAIRLAVSAQRWFGEGISEGAYRPRSIEDVIAASRPWRKRIKEIADDAFSLKPKLAKPFSDVNSSRTLDEEKTDLAIFNSLIKKHKTILEENGLTQELTNQGLTLAEEAEGRDLLAVLGLRSRKEALTMRNDLLTYAVIRGREARAAAINILSGKNDEAKQRFQDTSLRNAIRPYQERTKGSETEEEPAVTTPAEVEKTS